MSSESALWCAVIEQAFLDATSRPLPRWHDYPYRRIARDESREWLIYAPDDFIRVCDLAGVDADCVQEQAVSMALDGWHRPD